MGKFMGDVMADDSMRTLGKAVQKYAGKLPGAVKQLAPWQRPLLDADEASSLSGAAAFIAKELGVPKVTIRSADDDQDDHPKRAVAEPFKPGLALT